MESRFQHAAALQQAGRLDEAEAIYRQADGSRPAWVLANLGVILRTTGRLAEAEATLREALALEPTWAQARHTLGMTLLQLGRYAEGWAFYEARREIHRAPPPPPFPEWRGGDLKGKRLLVVVEQGLGDQILLARFLRALDADEVALACARPLVRLFAGLATEVGNPQVWDGISADCWTYLGMVPRWLELGPADAPAPYLAPAPRPASGTVRGTGTGLMLQGAATNTGNVHRLPGPQIARAIRGLGEFVDLSPEATGARDFAETAQIVAGLERVISVDTSVAHLAGAMGKPCWVLASRPAVDWYLNWNDDRTPWYPTHRILRQARPGDWTGVIRGVAEVLAGTRA